MMNPTRHKLGNKRGFAPKSWRYKGILALTLGATTLATANSAIAQEVPYVRIEMPEHNISIEGNLVGFDDDVFYIEGELGTLRIARTTAVCIGIGCPEGDTSTRPTAVREVALRSLDGETEIRGELVNVDGRHYVIRNRLGEFRVLKSDVECGGAACPDVEIYNPQFAIHGATPEVRFLAADMLRGYAAANNHQFEIDLNEGVPQKVWLMSSDSQEVVAEVDLILEDPKDALQVFSENAPDISILDAQQFNSQLSNVDDVDPTLLEKSLVAYDGLVVVGNRANPVRDLDFNELNSVWGGTVSSWRSLGGGDYPISVHMVSEDATTGNDAQIWLSNFGQSDLGDIVRHETEADVLEAVESDRNAIGIVHRAAAVSQHAKMLDLRKTCGLTSSPTSFDMQIAQYPLTQPVYAFGRTSGMHPVAQSFMAWTQSPEAQQLAGKSGFVGTALQRMKMQDMGVAVIHTAAVEPDFDGNEFSSMMRELRDADRLSISFRFLPGSATLDEASVQNVKDLAGRLRRSEFDGQEVLLVGFADSIGPADRNTALSQRRAQTVQNVLEQEFDPETLARLNVQSLSFGEQMPLDCNETDSGRANNRRVEVWVRTAS